MARPVCAHCGKPYGRRLTTTETIRWPLGEEPPPYRGNGILIKDGHRYQTPSRATIRGVTMLSVNPEIRASQEAEIDKIAEHSENTMMRTLWDGQSWSGGYAPFCTLRCALDYARSVYYGRQAARNVR